MIVVSSKAAAKHMLRHGDTLAPCPTTAAAPTKHHGNGNGNSQGNDKQGSDDGPGNSNNGHGKGHNK